MIRSMIPRILLLSLAFAIIAASSNAQVPQAINYQGRLTDAGGLPVANGPYQINFKIYGSETGDDSLWWSDFQSVQVTDGLFDYQLGSNNPLPSDFFGPGSDPFLGIIVDTDPEITPRTPIVSSAFSFRANYSDTASVAIIAQDITCYHCVSTADLDDGSINADKIAPGAVTGDKIQNGTIEFQDIGSNGAGEGQIMKMIGGYWTPANDETGSGGAGDITAVYPGSGLTGGGETGDVTLSVGNYSITSTHLAGSSVNSGHIEDWSISGIDIGGGVVETGHIQNNTILFQDIASNGAGEGEVMKMVGGNWTAATDETGGGGDITAVTASTGLDGGGLTGDVSLSVADLGIGNLQLANNSVSAAKMQNNSVWSDHIMDNEVGTDELDDNAVTSAKILDGTIDSTDIADAGVSLTDIAQSGAADDQAITWSEGIWQPTTVGDITSVTPSDLGGLEGGGSSGDIEIGIALNGVTTGLISNNHILDEDINTYADIEPSKIRGTAVNLTDAQSIGGTKTFEDLNIDATTRRLALSSAAFVPGSSAHSYLRGTGYLRNTATGEQYYWASVSLPHGASVTELRATFDDSDAMYDGSIQLIKIYMFSAGEVIMAGASTSGTPGLTTVNDTSINSETISNDAYNYYLLVSMQYNTLSLNMRLYGAEIVYTVTKPLP